MQCGMLTVITPVYNQEGLLKGYFQNLMRQTYGFEKLEIILVNDGSDDNSGNVCAAYSRKYKNVKYFDNPHSGVSVARNTGINAATGKYIFFLDVDDVLTSNTIEDCFNVFNAIYDQVDLLTYPIETYYKGRKLEPHFRYKYLKETGVYDLTTEAFIGQTTMNVVVKNKFDLNVLFDESMEFSEDQKYCCDILFEKLKMGFCSTAKYIYNRSEESASGRLSGACYIFETSMKMFEDIFARFEYVPVAFQGLFVNDFYWKMLENIFFPYHYDQAGFDEAMARVKALLRKCYNYVILDHPNFDYYEKFYIMRLKGQDTIQTELKKDEIAMYSEGYDVFRCKDVEMVVTKVRINGSKIRIRGFLKNVFFQFYMGSIELYAIENGKDRKFMEIRSSAHDYYRSHEATQRFMATEYECDVDAVNSLRFELKLGDTVLPVGYYIMPLVPFSKDVHGYRKDGVEIWLENRKWQFGRYETTPAERRKIVWLYYDCMGVEIDNGLRQYTHDLQFNDGIEKYYVLTDKLQERHIPKGAKTVEFGSDRHKKLILEADKIITAFIENDNIFPWQPTEYHTYANKMRFDVVYLQHGVLHVEMPWKYSPEKIEADKVVVSCDVDHDLFLKNGYDEKDLWKVKMPRFDDMQKKSGDRKKILFAPSWRSYLVTSADGHGWNVLRKKFYASKYYIGLKALFESDRISQILKDSGYSMDIKLHPIFMKEKLFDTETPGFAGDRIKFVKAVDEADYDLFITDFSSYMFDFLYMGIPVLSYIPDFDEFKCSMNSYRNVDFMDKVEPEEICKTPEELEEALQRFIAEGKAMDYHVEFYDGNGMAMDGIYHNIMELE